MDYLEAVQEMWKETGGLQIDVWLMNPANVLKIAEKAPVGRAALGGDYAYALQYLKKYCGLADDDELYRFCTSDATWVACCGRAGLAVFRKGKMVGLYGHMKKQRTTHGQ